MQPLIDPAEPTAPPADPMVHRVGLLALAATLLWFYLATSSHGLWEDGYFVARFARNFWRHGSFAWNVEEGPLYGMTSQTLQVVGTLLYKLAPHHLVLTLKASLAASLLLCLVWLGRLARLHTGSAQAVLPAVLGLTLPMPLQLVESGLETPYALLVLVVTLHVILKRTKPKQHLWSIAALCVLVYATRPDAILIPLVVLAVFALEGPRAHVPLALLTGLGLSAFLLACQAYYGTALPLPFYIKTHGLSPQTDFHVAVFAIEKPKNALQFLFITAPLVFVAAHDLSRKVVALLVSALVFAGYHYAFTIETMGHFSRFYVPALAPLLCASVLAYPRFRARASTRGCVSFSLGLLVTFVVLLSLDRAYRIPIVLRWFHYLPLLVGTAALLLLRKRARTTALVLGSVLFATTAFAHPMQQVSFQTDRQILLAQIRSRRVFRGLEQVAERIKVRTLLHTDMGAPGLLFPKARVIDLDGLLSREVAFGLTTFEELCVKHRPEAVFVPNPSYPELRAQVLSSPCMKHYRAVDKKRDSPLRVREDLVARYLKQP